MSTYILTSMFHNGFDSKITEVFQQVITKRNNFAFVASEFELIHEKTDKYFQFFLNMFIEKGIYFSDAYVVDSRMTAEEAQKAVAKADVVWLSGGNTPIEFEYFKKYGLMEVLKQHQGIIIGMSAGSINMSTNAICTLSCGHNEQQIYRGLGCVNISVEPHFIRSKISEEVLELSKQYEIYGLCDESIIVCRDDVLEFYGEVYRIKDGSIEVVE